MFNDKGIFPIASVYQFYRPTYLSGYWLFGFALKANHPIHDMNAGAWYKFGLKTKDYNTNLHFGAFALPTYVKESLNADE